MLNNNGQNIIATNLKEDSDTGEFYGFQNVYREIFKLFPEDFIDIIKEVNKLKDLKQILGFISYKQFFFLNNLISKEDFLANASNKFDSQIIISASIASIAGLVPIPFADIPVIIGLETGIIKYTAKLYGFTDDEYNIFELLNNIEKGINCRAVLGGISKILFFGQFLDVIPGVGEVVSVVINPGIIITFGYSIQNYFQERLTDERLIKIINNILNDYKSIYLQINQLCNREFNNYDNNINANKNMRNNINVNNNYLNINNGK